MKKQNIFVWIIAGLVILAIGLYATGCATTTATTTTTAADTTTTTAADATTTTTAAGATTTTAAGATTTTAAEGTTTTAADATTTTAADGTTTTAGDATTTTSTSTTTATTTSTVGAFILSSSAFDDSGSIPNKYAKPDQYYVGDISGAQNTSVPLSWSNLPEGTQTLSLVMVDLDAGSSAHWIVVNIPTSEGSLAEGASPDSLPAGCTEIANDYTAGQYEGPWPPDNETHLYRFSLYALNDSLDTGAISNFNTFLFTAMSKIIAITTLEGTFLW